jgi:acetyltransferase-like isoleucine patch superfamily enzyme
MFPPTDSFFDLKDFAHAGIFVPAARVWEALDALKPYMDSYDKYLILDRDLLPDGKPLPETVIFHDGRWRSAVGLTIEYGDTNKGGLKVSAGGKRLDGAAVIMAGAVLVGERFAFGPGVLVESQAMLKAPVICDDYTEVRQGAYLRGYCLVGKRCVLGHATEVKESIFLNDAKAGHFAYLGDSILGNHCNLGAGTKFANLRFIGGNIVIRYNKEFFDTGRRKLGAILGDGSQTGCNSVTNPGTIFGRECALFPNATAASGFHPNDKIVQHVIQCWRRIAGITIP